MADSGIPLSTLIAELRRELAEAKEQGQGHEFKLQVEEAEIELQVAITSTDDISGGVKFWVVNAEAKEQFSDAITQKIKLKLTPFDAKGKKFKMKATKEKAKI